MDTLEKAYAVAKEQYAAYGVDTEAALAWLDKIQLSMHCWQGDDVAGLESTGEALSGGIATTGNYPGQARNGDELRADLDLAYSLIPGTHRINLHASYAETDGVVVPRNELRPEHFSRWADWAKDKGHGVDFNPTFFSHPLAASGFTLSDVDAGIRQYWIEHAIACREIGAAFGKTLGTPTVTNVWIPDGMKDVPVDRLAPRERLVKSLDAIFEKEIDPAYNLDAVECKLFGLGSESYVVGSHEFYMGYAVSRGKLLTLDSGHFHPTEVISDKLSSMFLYVDEILLHVSRGVRWDSDHVVTLNDELKAIAHELVAGNFLDRVHIGLDYFDASINRIAAWSIGMRNTQKALLMAMLEPLEVMRSFENAGDYTKRLGFMETWNEMPFGAVWNQFCLTHGVPVGFDMMKPISDYEEKVLSKRG
ncbi:MAG: L-rhamnose isomerase [Anaerolineae bacterium]|nr:L-rhamnose isomerase [Anaerolineae bacterium]